MTLVTNYTFLSVCIVILAIAVCTITRYGITYCDKTTYDRKDTLSALYLSRFSQSSKQLTAFFCASVVGIAAFSGITYSHTAINSIDLRAIAQIESSGNPKAVGDDGNSLGLYQLSFPLIQDYNRLNKKDYTHKDALNPLISRKIALWAFQSYYPYILKAKGREVSVSALLTCFNAGCGRVDNPPASTVKYIEKYKRLTK